MKVNSLQIDCAKLAGFNGPQYQILVDGELINHYLNRRTRSRDFDRMVPPVDLVDPTDQQQVVNLLGQRDSVLPILVSSDLMDLTGTVIAVRVTSAAGVVKWESFWYGLDMSRPIRVQGMVFDEAAYDVFVAKVKDYIALPFSQFFKDQG